MENAKVYEVKFPLWVKIFPLIIYLASCFFIVYDYASSNTSFWNDMSFMEIIAAILFFFGFPIIFLIILFTKTVFFEKELVHTNLFLQKNRKPYNDIVGIEITARSDLRIYFIDRTSIKVLTGENYLTKTLQILENYIDIEVTREKSSVRIRNK